MNFDSVVGVLSVPSKNNPARFSGRFTYKKDFRKHLLRFLKSFSIYRSNEHSLYCRHGSISHFIYDQIQDQQMHRIKCVKEIFHSKATFSIVIKDWNECKHCCPFPPYKCQTSKHDLLYSASPEQVKYHNAENSECAVIR